MFSPKISGDGAALSAFPARDPLSYASRVSECFQEGLSTIENSLGYHGTSIQAIQYLLREGRLPPTTHASCGWLGPPDGESPRGISGPGCFYFMPVAQHFPDHANFEHFVSTRSAISLAGDYARTNAFTHALLEKLNLNFDDSVHYQLCSEIAEAWIEGRTAPEARFHALQMYPQLADDPRLGETRAIAAIRQAKDARGVIIVLERCADQIFSVVNGDVPEDLALDARNGIPLEAIRGIEPRGDAEFDFLDSLCGGIKK